MLTVALLCPAAVWAQGLSVRVQAGRVQGFAREGETVVVYQGDAVTDVRVQGSRTVVKDGARETQTFDVRAEAVVAFLEPLPASGARGPRVPIRGLYAQGFVRVEVSTEKLGQVVFEAEELYLDFVDERAYLSQAVVRLQPKAGPATSGLLSTAFVVRARSLRVQGADELLAEDASVTACEHGVPHFALGGRRLRVYSKVARPTVPAAAGAVGGLGGLLAAHASRERLLAGLQAPRGRKPQGGSDALSRVGREPRQVELEGVSVHLLGHEVPVLPWFTWGSDWPIPEVKVGNSSRFGNFGHLGVKLKLGTLGEAGRGHTVTLNSETTVDYYETRGTAGGLGLDWTHDDKSGRTRGRGFFRADGLRDRANFDRVGTAIRNEGRFWLRGLVTESLAPSVEGRFEPSPFRLDLDAEFSRFSDPGYLLEYHRVIAQSEKEQETYVNLRSAWDDIAARILTRQRVNDFQSQLERLPEVRLDWIKTPIATDATWGGLYLDAALRAGQLRWRPDDAGGESYRALRGDVDLTLEYKNTFGPFQFRGWGGARQTVWSDRRGSRGGGDSIDRFAGSGGWNLSLPLWRRWETPFGVFRHQLLPEVGMRHTYDVTRHPAELLQFDEVERVLPRDEVFLRIRTVILTDVQRRRQKVVDLSVEARYLLRETRFDRGAWSDLTWDLRIWLLPYVQLRARVDQDVQRGGLLDLNVQASVEPFEGFEASLGYLELFGAAGRSLTWSVRWRVTKSWAASVTQQYDFDRGTFLRHSGKLVRYFHRFALEVVVSNDPQQNDTSASVNVAALWSADDDPF